MQQHLVIARTWRGSILAAISTIPRAHEDDWEQAGSVPLLLYWFPTLNSPHYRYLGKQMGRKRPDGETGGNKNPRAIGAYSAVVICLILLI